MWIAFAASTTSKQTHAANIAPTVRSADMKIGFCGTGQIAQALMQGLLQSGHSVVCWDPVAASLAQAAALGAKAVASNAQVAEQSQVVFLATKPQYIVSVAKEIKPALLNKDVVVVTVAAGVSCAAIEAQLPKGTRVVRVMPNTPALVKAMAAGYCGGSSATAQDLALVGDLLRSLGAAVQGPAYVFMFVEALADGGVKAGLPRDAALLLAIHTVRGAAEMLLQTNQHPGVLKDGVCSPGGTTIDAVAALEARGFRGSVMQAVVVAADRSRVLGAKM
jgi:pyrroline-5-carboxylate reductase